MRKQKKDKRTSKQKSGHSNHLPFKWSEEHFSELYMQSPNILTSSTFFIIGLNYRGNLLKVKLPTGIQNKHLHYIFHQEIYRYLLNIRDNNPLLRTAEVIGFQSIDEDILLDYQICIGKGILKKKTSFNCLEYSCQGRLKKYKIYKCLAIGGFSKVYLVRSFRDGQFYAMKIIKKSTLSQDHQNIILNEKQICSKLNHPFIVKMNHCFQTKNFFCFVFDYCPGGELFFYLRQVKKMNQNDARFYFIQILYGLMYLHQQKIIYRDLKPQNLLINHDGHIKIADFGLSKPDMSQRGVTYSFCGSTQYMPPEMILGQGHSFGVDLYTLGALLYELVTGLPPFYSRDQQQIKMAILNQQLTFPSHIQLSSQIKHLLIRLLNKNPKLRIGSAKGLKQILFHPWIGKVNSQNILSKDMLPPYVPPINQFNFDDSELGDDQAQFTELVLQQRVKQNLKKDFIFDDFQYKNETHLKPQVKKIMDTYAQKKILLNQSSSMKCLSTSIRVSDKTLLKRQLSSPYLQSIERNIQYNPRNKSLDRKSSCKLLLQRSAPKKQSLTRFNPVGKSWCKKSSGFLSTVKSKENSYYPSAHAGQQNNYQSKFLRKKKAVCSKLFKKYDND